MQASAHGTALSNELRVIPVEGLPEIREGDDLAELIAAKVELEDGDVVVFAQKVVSKAEGRVVRLDEIEPSERARRDRRRRPGSAPHRGDPPRGEARRARAQAARDRGDAARLHLRVGRRRLVERTRAGHARAAAARSRRIRAAPARTVPRAHRPRRRACSSPTRSAVRGGRGRSTSRSARPGSR